MQSQPPAETKETQRGFTRSFSHPGVLNTKVQKGTLNSNRIQCVGSPKPNKPSRIGYSKFFVTFLIETLSFDFFRDEEHDSMDYMIMECT